MLATVSLVPEGGGGVAHYGNAAELGDSGTNSSNTVGSAVAANRVVSLYIHAELVKGAPTGASNTVTASSGHSATVPLKMTVLANNRDALMRIDADEDNNGDADNGGGARSNANAKRDGGNDDDDEDNAAAAFLKTVDSLSNGNTPLINNNKNNNNNTNKNNTLLLSFDGFTAAMRNLATLLMALVALSDGGCLEDGDEHPSSAVIDKRRTLLCKFITAVLSYSTGASGSSVGGKEVGSPSPSLSAATAADDEGFVSLLPTVEMLSMVRMLTSFEASATAPPSTSSSNKKKKRNTHANNTINDKDSHNNTSTIDDGDDADDDDDDAAIVLADGRGSCVARLLAAANSLSRQSQPLGTPAKGGGGGSSSNSAHQQQLPINRQVLKLRQELSIVAKCILCASEVKSAASAERLGQHVQAALLPRLTLTLSSLRAADGTVVDILPLRSVLEMFWAIVPAIVLPVGGADAEDTPRASGAASPTEEEGDDGDAAASSSSHSQSPTTSVLSLRTAHLSNLAASRAIIQQYHAELSNRAAFVAEQTAVKEGLAMELAALRQQQQQQGEASTSGGADGDAAVLAAMEGRLEAIGAALAEATAEVKALRRAIRAASAATVDAFWPSASESSRLAATTAYGLLVRPPPTINDGDAAPSSLSSSPCPSPLTIQYLLPDHYLHLLTSFVVPFHTVVGSLLLLDGRRLFHMVAGGGADEEGIGGGGAATAAMGSHQAQGGGGGGGGGGGSGQGGDVMDDAAWRRVLMVPDGVESGTTPSRYRRSSGMLGADRDDNDSSCAAAVGDGSPSQRKGFLTGKALLLRPYKYAASVTSPWSDTVGSPNRRTSEAIAANRRGTVGAAAAAGGGSGGRSSGAGGGAPSNRGSTSSNTTTNAASNSAVASKRERDDTANAAGTALPSTSSSSSAPLLGRPSGGESTTKKIRFEEEDGTVGGGGDEKRKAADGASSSAAPTSALTANGGGGVDAAAAAKNATVVAPAPKAAAAPSTSSSSSSSGVLAKPLPSFGGGSVIPSFLLGPTANTASVYSRSGNRPVNVSVINADGVGKTTISAAVIAAADAAGVTLSSPTSPGNNAGMGGGGFGPILTSSSAAAAAATVGSAAALSVSSSQSLMPLPSNVLLPPPPPHGGGYGGAHHQQSITAGILSSGGVPSSMAGGSGPLFAIDGTALFAAGGGQPQRHSDGVATTPGRGVLSPTTQHQHQLKAAWGPHHPSAAAVSGGSIDSLFDSASSWPPSAGGGPRVLTPPSVCAPRRPSGGGGATSSASVAPPPPLEAPVCGGVADGYRMLLNEELVPQLVAEEQRRRRAKEQLQGGGDERGAAGGRRHGRPFVSPREAATADDGVGVGGKGPSSSSSVCGAIAAAVPQTVLSTVPLIVCACCGKLPLVSPLSYSERHGATVGAVTPVATHALNSSLSRQPSSTANSNSNYSSPSTITVASGSVFGAPPPHSLQPSTPTGGASSLAATSGGVGLGVLRRPAVGGGGAPSLLPHHHHGALLAPPTMMHHGGGPALNGNGGSGGVLASGPITPTLVTNPHHYRAQFNQSPSAAAAINTVSGSAAEGEAGGVPASSTATLRLLVASGALAQNVTAANAAAAAALSPIAAYHFKALSAMFPLRYACCGSLQCASCCDLNRCAVCGEEDVLPARAREALLALLTEAATSGASPTAAEWLPRCASSDPDALPTAAAPTGDANAADADAISGSATSNKGSAAARFNRVPSVVVLAEIAAELEHIAQREGDADHSDSTDSCNNKPTVFGLVFEEVALLQQRLAAAELATDDAVASARTGYHSNTASPSKYGGGTGIGSSPSHRHRYQLGAQTSSSASGAAVHLQRMLSDIVSAARVGADVIGGECSSGSGSAALFATSAEDGSQLFASVDVQLLRSQTLYVVKEVLAAMRRDV